MQVLSAFALALAVRLPAAPVVHRPPLAPVRMCADPLGQRQPSPNKSLAAPAPLVTKETLDQVRAELYRTSVDDAPINEQRDLIGSLLGPIEEVLVQQQQSSDAGPLNAVVAPHLPVLLGRSFPLAARAALQGGLIRTEGERAALLALSEYVMEAQREIAEALEELQWRQQQKLRELCDAATDGGTERVLELAEAMRSELDTDFCNFLNFAIEQEEARLVTAGATPFVPPSIVGGQAPAALVAEEAAAQAAAAAAGVGRALGAGADDEDEDGGGGSGSGQQWQQVIDGVTTPWGAVPGDLSAPQLAGVSDADFAAAATAATAAAQAAAAATEGAAAEDAWADDEEEVVPAVSPGSEGSSSSGWRIEEQPPPSWMSTAAAEGANGAVAAAAAAPAPAPSPPSVLASAREVEQQQWLLVLRLVRQGVYALLARDYQDDVKHLRYIIGLTSAQARLELTQSTMLAMSAEQQAKFEKTVERIAANLSVQRDARDLEIFTKVKEVQAHVKNYHRGYGGAGGQGEWDQV